MKNLFSISKPMTVGVLIKKLNALPKNADISCCYEGNLRDGNIEEMFLTYINNKGEVVTIGRIF